MKTITVTIPAQKFDYNKYYALTDDEKCYLHEALSKVFPKSQISVGSFGKTTIDKIAYEPLEAFSAGVIRESFNQDKDIIVTFKPVN